MYKISSIFTTILILSACSDNTRKSNFELKGTFENSKGETIYLEKLSGPQPIAVDSTIVDDKGDFEFTSYVPSIGFYRIKVSPQNFAMLVLDSNDKATVTGDLNDLGNTYKVEGSRETNLFLEYNDITRKRELRLDSLNKAFQLRMEASSMDTKKMEAISKEFEGPYNDIMTGSSEELKSRILQNKDMYSSLMAIQSLEPDKYAELFRELDAGLSKKYPEDSNVKMFHDRVQQMLATTVGQIAPDITMLSPDGNSISLSSLRGKFVLIDFWASWCGPCRKEMPIVVKAYSKYKNKGFEIFGVSLDQDKGRWVEAIEKDGITWPQVSDLQQWNSPVVKQYGIQGIPFTVLLDKEGKILAKNLRGDDLEKKLSEVLN